MAKKKETKKTIKKVAPKKKLADAVSVEKTVMSSTEEISVKAANKVNYFMVVVVLVLAGAFLYFAKSLFVVALVNGRPISRLSVVKQLERTSGQTALDSIVNQVLIEQEAKKEGITVTDADVQAELDKVKKQIEDQGLNLDSALSAQGMTLADLEQNLKMKKTVEVLLKDNIQVSDDEVKKYFEDNKELFGKDAKFDDLETSIKEQLASDKLSSEFQAWYTKLKSEADIKYFLNY